MSKSICWSVALALVACAPSLAATVPGTGTLPADCNRECLYGVMDQFIAGLERRDATRVPWAPNAKYTENNVQLAIGDGVFATATAIGKYRLKFADLREGQVGLFGEVQETNDTSAFGLRLKVVNRYIAEAEMVIVRIADFPAIGGGVNPFANPTFVDTPILSQVLKPAERTPRERMISVADGYFDTLQLNDGKLFTEFHPDCNRIENRLQTTNNATKPLGPYSALGCADQFKLGVYRYDDRLRARRFPLIDEELGIVLAGGFIDHAGRLGSYQLTDGTMAESPLRRPHSFVLLEAFKVMDGKLRQIEAVFINVPYNMQSPWGP